jgi:hypothetical protein
VTAAELVIWGVVVHLVVDWLFKNRWIAENKSSLTHPSGYVHAGLHTAAMLLVFPAAAAAALGVAHLLIDTRVPLRAWARVVSVPEDGPLAIDVHIWRDQTAHIACIALAALIVA